MRSGKDFQLPPSDRDFEDTRTAMPPRDLHAGITATIPPKAEREGFTAYLERLSKDPAVVPVCRCLFCGDDFNSEPTVPVDMHSEEAKKKGLTWCSPAHRDAVVPVRQFRRVAR